MKLRKNYKMLILTIIILMLRSSFTSTATFLSTDNEKSATGEANNFELTLSTDPKIQSIIDMINETMLRNYLETLVGFAPRYTGTYGCEKTAEYIYNHFESLGLDVRYQEWTAFGNRWHPGIFTSNNVEGTLPGAESDRTIIFNAHYDTVKGTPGADDNGGSVAAVLTAAYVLSQFEFNHTLKFVTFSGEEIGLLGSHAYAKEAYYNNDEIIVDLNADMIAHTATPEGAHRFRAYGTQDTEWVLDAIEGINTDYGIDFELIRGIIDEEGMGGSDYFSFVEYGYEAVAFFEHDWNPRMHQENDTIEFIDFNYLVNTTRLIVATMAYLADSDCAHPYVQIEFPKMGKSYRKGEEKRDIRDLSTLVFNDIWIWANVQPESTAIERAEFYYDNNLEYTDYEPPFKWHMNKLSIRKHTITVIVYDTLGRTAQDSIDICYINLFTRR